jgi:hypothetical protein
MISVDDSMDQHDINNASFSILESISIDFLLKGKLNTNRKIFADILIDDILDANSQSFNPLTQLLLEVGVSNSHMMQVMEDYLE